MFKKPQVRKTKTTLNSLRIYMRGVAKFGKTQMFRDMILEEYDGNAEKGLLVGIGNEIGYCYLDELNTSHVESWSDMEELKSWLIKGKKNGEHEIEIIGWDTVDELIPIVEKEVCRLSQVSSGKPCDSINKAMGGYGKGQDKVKELIKKYFNDLYKAGFGLMAISHVKHKNIIEKGCEESEGYMVLTSNLPNTYENIFSDIFDVMVTGLVDREVVDGRIQSAVRKLYFRDNGYVVAGSRLPGKSVPEYMILDSDKNNAEEFIKVLKDAMKSAIKKPVTDDEFKEMVKEEKAEMEEKLDEVIEEIDKEDEVSADDLVLEIKKLTSDVNKKGILLKEMKTRGKKINQFSVDELKEILAIMNK